MHPLDNKLIGKGCFCSQNGEPTENQIHPKGNWVCAGMNGTLPTKSYWQPSDEQCASKGRNITPEKACNALLQFGEVVFVGDSISRQFFQGLLVLLTDDWQAGSLWSARLVDHNQQWGNANWFRWWPLGQDGKNTDPACQGPIQQFDEGCRMNVVLDTTNLTRICGGHLKMRFWHSWHTGAGFEELLSTVVPHLSPNALVVTNTGMHPGFGGTAMQDWMNGILQRAPFGTQVIWHTNDPPGTKKPIQYLPHQGRETIYKELLKSVRVMDDLQSKFPQHVIDLISFWNVTEKANSQCTHDLSLPSSDGTHYPLLVNEEKARLLVIKIQEKCAAVRLKKIGLSR